MVKSEQATGGRPHSSPLPCLLRFLDLDVAEFHDGAVVLRMTGVSKKPADEFQALSRAVDLLPNRDDVKVKAADLVLSSFLADNRRPKTLHDRVTALADHLLAKDADSYDGLRLKAHLALADKNFKDAERLYRRANAAKPMQSETVLGWVQALLQDGRPAEKLILWSMLDLTPA
jgi:hypothetical protein